MSRRRRVPWWLAAASVALVACGGAAVTHTDAGDQGIPVIEPVVLDERSHDTSAWVQGLEFDGSTLYEGTGIAGKSQVREIDQDTGEVLRSAATPNNYYGEGLTVVGDRIWQLTWQDGVAIEWDKNTLTPLREVAVKGEGWGLCFDGERLIRSDGTDKLRFHDPATFDETEAVSVTRDGMPMTHLNELECVDGQVWANVWQTDMIVRIDPSTGQVNRVLDATDLSAGQGDNSNNVLNGIAHVEGDEYLLTGKMWPSMFLVRVAP